MIMFVESFSEGVARYKCEEMLQKMRKKAGACDRRGFAEKKQRER